MSELFVNVCSCHVMVKVCLAVVCMKGGFSQIHSQIADYFCYLDPLCLYNVLYLYLMILGKVIHPI